MPRDIFTSDSKDDALVASPGPSTPRQGAAEIATATNEDGYQEFTIHRDETSESAVQQFPNTRVKNDEKNNLHPYLQTLSLSDLESCVALENAVFPEHERCSREKFIYRLTTCPELSLGIFTTTPSPPSLDTPTFSTAHPADTSTPSRKSVLIAMITANRTTSPSVTDASMEYPPDWRTQQPKSPSETRGHLEHGRTICVQTLGVLPAYQGRGLGTVLMKSYEQRMESSGIADRIALLAHGHLVRMYEKLGFVDTGKSEVKFGGGGWTNLIYDFAEHAPGMTFQS